MWTLARFNQLETSEAVTQLLKCCSAPSWAQTVAAARPFTDLGSLRAAADAAFGALDAEQIRQAVAAHPAIGTRSGGGDTESTWSRSEQGAVLAAGDEVKAQFAEANRQYQRRFGQVFLCRAAGRSPAELLTEARRRLANDPETEAVEVATELRAIVALRVERLVAP